MRDLKADELEKYRKLTKSYQNEITLKRNRINRNAAKLIEKFSRERWFAAKTEILPHERFVPQMVRIIFYHP